MSFYPTLFAGATSGMRTYILQIGKHTEDVIVYKLDADGKPIEFVCGKAKLVIGEPLKAINPTMRIIEFKSWDGGPPTRPWHWGFRGNRWRDVAKDMNGKGIAAGKARERMSLMRELDVDIAELEEGDDCKWRVTGTGLAADVRLDSEANS